VPIRHRFVRIGPAFHRQNQAAVINIPASRWRPEHDHLWHHVLEDRSLLTTLRTSVPFWPALGRTSIRH